MTSVLDPFPPRPLPQLPRRPLPAQPTEHELVLMQMARHDYFWSEGKVWWPKDWTGKGIARQFFARFLLEVGGAMFQAQWKGWEPTIPATADLRPFPADSSEADYAMMDLAHRLVPDEPVGGLLGVMMMSAEGYAKARELQAETIEGSMRLRLAGNEILEAIQAGEIITYARTLTGEQVPESETAFGPPVDPEKYWALDNFWPRFKVSRFLNRSGDPLADLYIYVDTDSARKFLERLPTGVRAGVSTAQLAEVSAPKLSEAMQLRQQKILCYRWLRLAMHRNPDTKTAGQSKLEGIARKRWPLISQRNFRTAWGKAVDSGDGRFAAWTNPHVKKA